MRSCQRNCDVQTARIGLSRGVSRNLTRVKVRGTADGLIYDIGAAIAKLKPIDSIGNNGICNVRDTRIGSTGDVTRK